jgi:Fe(3+) dicitrate transport protein
MRRSVLTGAVSLVLVSSATGVALADDPPAQKPDESAPPSDAKKEADRLAEQPPADAANPYVLPGEIVVTAKSGGVPLSFPHQRDIVDRETLQTFPQGALTETLRQVPGVFIQSDAGNDIKMSIGIRGQQARASAFTGILVDGIPVKQTLYGVVDLDIMPFTFERAWRVDVIEGGADLRYGPNAYGGVINFITEPIPEKPTVRFRGAYGSDDEYSTMTAAGGTFGQLGVLVTGVDKGGDGWRDHSEYEQQDASAKFRWRFDDANELNWSINRYVEDVEFASGLTQAQFEDDPKQSRAEHDFGRGDVNRYTAQFLHTFSHDSAFELISWFHQSFREYSLAQPVLPPFTKQNHLPSEYRHWGVEARMSWAIDIAGVRNSFYHSGRYYGDRANRTNYTEPYAQEGFGPHTLVTDADFTTESFAFFNEDTISLLDNLDLAVGVRNETIAMNADNKITGAFADSRFTESLPESTLTWRALPKSALFASWSKGFGTPLYTTMDPSSTSYNPDLKAEKATNKEAGVRTREIAGLEASATYFQQEYDDKIERSTTPAGITKFFNTQGAHVDGYVLAASYELGGLWAPVEGLSIFGNYTRQESVIEHGSSAPGKGDDLEGNRAPNAPKLLANVGLRYRHASGLWARVTRSQTGGYYSDALNSEPPSADGVNGFVPGFTIWDASVGWNQKPDGTGFSVAFGCTNVFDDTDWFRRNTTGIQPGAPRRFNVNVGYAVNF